MKPWEETWEAVTGPRPFEVVREGTNEKIAEVWEGHPATELLAAAPEMARLLLEAQWSADVNAPPYEQGSPGCPWCFGEQPQPWNGQILNEEVAGHRDDCRLVAVLRKAGVL